MIVRAGVAELVKQISPHGICDDCIARELGWGHNRRPADQTIALSTQPKFHREKEQCYKCKDAKFTVRYDPRHPI